MTDCPNCEYHRQRAQRWREEAYRQAGHPLPEREWIGLTPDELNAIFDGMKTWSSFQITDVYFAIEAKLKEKNT